MPTQKRRVIYLSDLEWETAKRLAEESGSQSISGYVRSLIVAWDEVRAEGNVTAAILGEPPIDTVPAKVGAYDEATIARFNSRGSRPVPKK
jgi:hypothetical protein